MRDSIEKPGQAGTEKMERLENELAEKLTLWEDSSLLAKEFARDLIRTVLIYYPNGRGTEEDQI